MRKNYPVTQREVMIPPGQRLITTTNLKGVITYCNQPFADIVGYTKEELIGQAHNIIRHPDMPQIAFQNMWDTLKSGKPWMGLVKNRCKSGDHYWVSAYVTPIYENGQITGYESVRTAPSRYQVKRAEKLYKKLRESKISPLAFDKLASAFSLGWPIAISAGLCIGGIHYGMNPIGIGMVLGAHAIGGIAIYNLLASKLKYISSLRPDAFKHPLIAKGYTNQRGTFSDIAMILISEGAKLETVLGRIEDQALSLHGRVEDGSVYINKSNDAITGQKTETDQIAEAITQMTKSIQGVSAHINASAEESQDTKDEAISGGSLSEETCHSIETLVSHVESIRNSIEELGRSTDAIQEATSLIDGIAEQTNLLALNAAIEAARAGEHGRGFAVVADEVRSLASRTQESTSKISSVIQGFQSRVADSVSQTREGEIMANEGLDKVRKTACSLEKIAQSVTKMADRFSEVSSSVNEQGKVSNEIGDQIGRISDLAKSSSESSDEAQKITNELKDISKGLYDFIARFSGTIKTGD